MNIGITFYAKDPGHNQIWTNGITQNACYLAEVISNIGYDVYLVNTSKNVVEFSVNDKIKVVNYHEIKNDLDVVFLLGSSLFKEDLDLHKSKGCKIVYYSCGNEYLFNMENSLFKIETNSKHFEIIDQIWLIPQLMKQCSFFHTTLNKTKTIEVPFLWSPVFLEKISNKLDNNGLYKPKNDKKRISIFEPNVNVCKYSMYPILISEALYRENSKLIDKVYVTNALKIKENIEFVSIMEHLDLYMDGRISFEGRFTTPYFLSTHTDVVVSHQWENALNYLYLDVVYLGYPLVHNAYLCSDLGYYYKEFDGHEGKNQLLKAINDHDKNYEEYRENNRKLLYRYSPSNPKLISKYKKLINNLFKK